MPSGKRNTTAECGTCGVTKTGVMMLFTIQIPPGSDAVKNEQAVCRECAVPALRTLMNAGLEGGKSEDVHEWQMLLTDPAADGPERFDHERVRFRCGACGRDALELGDVEAGSEEDGGGLVHHVRDGGPDGKWRRCGPCLPVPACEDTAPPEAEDTVYACTSCGEGDLTETWPYAKDDERAGQEYHYQPEETGNHEPCGPVIPQGSDARKTWYRDLLVSTYGAFDAEAHAKHAAARAARHTAPAAG